MGVPQKRYHRSFGVFGETSPWRRCERSAIVVDEDNHAVTRILAKAPASLDAGTREAIEKILTDEWIDELRRDMPLEWNWGQDDGEEMRP